MVIGTIVTIKFLSIQYQEIAYNRKEYTLDQVSMTLYCQMVAIKLKNKNDNFLHLKTKKIH